MLLCCPLVEGTPLVKPVLSNRNMWGTCNLKFSSCCCCSVTNLCLTGCNPMDCRCQAALSFTISQSLLKFLSIELVMPSNHLILCCPLLLLPSVSSSMRVFSSESALGLGWPEYWSFSIGPSNEYSGLISFRMDWFDLFAVFKKVKKTKTTHRWY